MYVIFPKGWDWCNFQKDNLIGCCFVIVLNQSQNKMKKPKFKNGQFVKYVNGNPTILTGEILETRKNELWDEFEYLIEERPEGTKALIPSWGTEWRHENQIKETIEIKRPANLVILN